MAENNDSSSFEAARNRVRNMNDTAMRYSALGNGFINYPKPQLQSGSEPRISVSEEKPAVQNNPIQSILGGTMINSFFAGLDADRLLLMMLIVVLVSEGKNYILAAALIYVMM